MSGYNARRHALPAIAVGAVGFLLTLTGIGNV
jgi:preprotein translocase subunit Sss1